MGFRLPQMGHRFHNLPIQPDFSQYQPAAITLNTGSPGQSAQNSIEFSRLYNALWLGPPTWLVHEFGMSGAGPDKVPNYGMHAV